MAVATKSSVMKYILVVVIERVEITQDDEMIVEDMLQEARKAIREVLMKSWDSCLRRNLDLSLHLVDRLFLVVPSQTEVIERHR